MGMTKKMLALMLVVVLGLASALTVSAAGTPSPKKAPAATKATYPFTDNNVKDHNEKTVVSGRGDDIISGSQLFCQ